MYIYGIIGHLNTFCAICDSNNNQNTIGLLPSLLQDLAVRKVSTIHTSAPSSSIVRASCCCGGVSVGEGNGSDTMYFAFFDESNRFHLSKVS